jgi:enoyl-CoA hydratase
MRIHLDEQRCTGHGRCYTLAEALFEPDDYGHSVVLHRQVAAGLEAEARLAADNCPEGAITLEADEPGPVVRKRVGAVEVLTLNRPDAANSLSPQLMADLVDALADIEADPQVQVVVLTGAGEKVFCAGMDLKAFGEQRDSSSAQASFAPMGTGRLFDGTYPKPVIAAVNGAAVGGGFELVLGCDLVVAADHARFGLPEVKRGLFAAGGGTMLGTRIPLALALEIGLTGDYISAHRAAELGLVNRVVPKSALLATALELAERVAANGPIGLRVTKQLMRAGVSVSPELGRATPEIQAEVFASQDAKEGAAAFMERRAPRWTGR